MWKKKKKKKKKKGEERRIMGRRRIKTFDMRGPEPHRGSFLFFFCSFLLSPSSLLDGLGRPNTRLMAFLIVCSMSSRLATTVE
jgi:hypothetical protein